MTDAKLKRCPFCGGEGNVHLSSDKPSTIFGMNCRDCGCVGPWEDTEEEAIAAWNRREKPSKEADDE